MHISLVQQGLIAQQEFAKLVMMGSKGRIELAPPLTDDERRDFELHVKGQYGYGLAAQVKSTMSLRRIGGNARYLDIFFHVRAARLVNDPLYWYFLAYLDPKIMRFADPVFPVPSKELHARAEAGRHGAFRTFSLQASMEPKSRDQWQPFRVNTLELGEKVLEIMADLKRRRVSVEQAAAILSMPDALRVMAVSRRAR
jgi:hypothetical protein